MHAECHGCKRVQLTRMLRRRYDLPAPPLSVAPREFLFRNPRFQISETRPGRNIADMSLHHRRSALGAGLTSLAGFIFGRTLKPAQARETARCARTVAHTG